jgi:hypothetical protein
MNDVLTRGYARPTSLAQQANLFNRFSAPECAGQPHDVLVVGYELNKARVCYLLFAIALLGAMIGIAVGLATRSAEWGGIVGADVFGLIAVVQFALLFEYGGRQVSGLNSYYGVYYNSFTSTF